MCLSVSIFLASIGGVEKNGD